MVNKTNMSKWLPSSKQPNVVVRFADYTGECLMKVTVKVMYIRKPDGTVLKKTIKTVASFPSEQTGKDFILEGEGIVKALRASKKAPVAEPAKVAAKVAAKKKAKRNLAELNN